MKINHIFIISLTVILAVIFTASTVNAQTKRERLESKQRIDQMVNTLKKELSLSKEQVAKVKEIVAENFKNTENARESFEGDREARMKSRMERTQAMDKKIESILTKDQKTKYEQYKKDRMQRFQQGRSRSNDSNPR
ncbi:MAG: hypothetical protein KJ666_09045 [Bacteroidetes bacterium]|nr:hypothetical protein [Bacteroidota bacterium]MBU2586309.1 hypothetical protein [Bacteroidota bacterium]